MPRAKLRELDILDLLSGGEKKKQREKVSKKHLPLAWGKQTHLVLALRSDHQQMLRLKAAEVIDNVRSPSNTYLARVQM